VLIAQAGIGAAGAIFPPAVGALTLGLVGRAALARRTGRNEAFNHGGNVAVAGLIGGSAYLFGYGAMFAVVAIMAACSIIAVLSIRERDIDHNLARGDDHEPGGAAVGLRELFRDRRIVVFIASAVIFHFANAAMLPLVGQKSSDGLKEGAALLMMACIIAAQVVMVPVALAASRLAASWGRKPVFLIGFAVLPVRGLMYCLGANPVYLVAVQLLDGIGAGIFGVVSVLVIADLTRGTGRYNFTQGALATATGLGSALSNVLAGYLVKAAGFNAGFLALAAVAVGGSVFFAIAMPETRDPRDADRPGSTPPRSP
jgi:Na+/melibiose symporter-like transporter